MDDVVATYTFQIFQVVGMMHWNILYLLTLPVDVGQYLNENDEEEEEEEEEKEAENKEGKENKEEEEKK
ncbi:hypothetical protein U3516DRAFT_732380 [Neocallimastix sp. 'constans']